MNTSDGQMKVYYKERAPVYDRVYSFPERQNDLRILESYIPCELEGLDILEVAAGTGYWTQFISQKANSILATDATVEALNQIQQRKIDCPVETKVVDAYKLGTLGKCFSGAFAGLWLSHVPKQDLNVFFGELHKCMNPGAKILLIDNSIAQCERLPLTYTDDFGNTYQDRELADGTIHRVLKNFPSQDELFAVTNEIGKNHKFMELDYFWLFQYQSV